MLVFNPIYASHGTAFNGSLWASRPSFLCHRNWVSPTLFPDLRPYAVTSYSKR